MGPSPSTTFSSSGDEPPPPLGSPRAGPAAALRSAEWGRAGHGQRRAAGPAGRARMGTCRKRARGCPPKRRMGERLISFVYYSGAVAADARRRSCEHRRHTRRPAGRASRPSKTVTPAAAAPGRRRGPPPGRPRVSARQTQPEVDSVMSRSCHSALPLPDPRPRQAGGRTRPVRVVHWR